MTDSGRDLTSDAGWGQVADGLVGANVRDVDITGGWPRDARSFGARLADLLGFYAIVFAVVLGVLAVLTVAVRS
jgi:hypothetical protein